MSLSAWCFGGAMFASGLSISSAGWAFVCGDTTSAATGAILALVNLGCAAGNARHMRRG